MKFRIFFENNEVHVVMSFKSIDSMKKSPIIKAKKAKRWELRSNPGNLLINEGQF